MGINIASSGYTKSQKVYLISWQNFKLSCEKKICPVSFHLFIIFFFFIFFLPSFKLWQNVYVFEPDKKNTTLWKAIHVKGVDFSFLTSWEFGKWACADLYFLHIFVSVGYKFKLILLSAQPWTQLKVCTSSWSARIYGLNCLLKKYVQLLIPQSTMEHPGIPYYDVYK